MYKANKIIYSINVADLQEVASGKLGRPLSDAEVKMVGNALGDFIDWYQAIENAIDIRLENVAQPQSALDREKGKNAFDS